MNKKLFIILGVFSTINGMDLPVRIPREWPAEEYANGGNTKQVANFIDLLNRHQIDTRIDNVISFGCGTGEIEKYVAQKAKTVHGIDASENMINVARTNQSKINNLTFEHCFAEDFKTKQHYDLALMSCCFHWFENKKQALERISDSLRMHGKLFTNIETESNPIPFGIAVYEDMKRDVPLIGTLLAALPNPTGSARLTDTELRDMLYHTNFEILRYQTESFDWTMTEQEWRKTQLPLLLSTPGAQSLINATSENNWITNTTTESFFYYMIQGKMTPKELKQHNEPFFPESSNEFVVKLRKNNFCRYLFNNFLNRCLTKFTKNLDGTYTYTYSTTAILAKKIN